MTASLSFLCPSALPFAALLIAGLSCQAPGQHPPYAEGNCSPHCAAPVGKGGRPGSATQDSDAAAPEREAGVEGSWVEVSVRQALDLEGTHASILDAPTAATEFGVQSDMLPIQAGPGEPLYVPVTDDGGFWVLGTRDGSSDVQGEYFQSLVWLHPDQSNVVQPLFPKRVLDDVANGLAFAPTSIDPTLAHAVLQVQDARGRPKAGVAAFASSGVVAYGIGGTASDAVEATIDGGVLVWLNVPSVGAGAAKLVLVSIQDEVEVRVPLLAGAVTIAPVTAP